jgi:uncharacterized membrane protein YecN with MAPEG domain
MLFSETKYVPIYIVVVLDVAMRGAVVIDTARRTEGQGSNPDRVQGFLRKVGKNGNAVVYVHRVIMLGLCV